MLKKLIPVVRIIFGILLAVLGSFSFMNLPIPNYPDKAKAFMVALSNTGYINYVIGIVFMIVGVMFIFGRFLALGALLLAPISFNIILFHVFLDISSIPLGLLVALLNGFIAYTQRDKYKQLFNSK